MAERLIEAGISVISEFRPEGLSDEASSDFVSRALRSINIKRLPVRCVLLLATADWCRVDSEIPRKVRSAFKQSLGYEVPLIGGSMAGFYCSTEQSPKISHGLMLIAICSMDLWVTVGHLRKPHELTETEREQELFAVARELNSRAGVRLGASANKSLFGILPGVISDGQGNRVYYDNELHGEILAAFRHRYQIVGASAADSSEPTSGFQFADDLCLESSLAIAIVETDLSTAALTGHGFVPYENVRVSVDGLADGEKSGYVVTLLDGQPPTQRLLELYEASSANAGKQVFGLPCGNDYNVIRPLLWQHDSTNVRFKRKVSIGDHLYMLTSSPKQMLQTAANVLGGVLKSANADVSDLSMLIGFSCVGRMKDYRAENPNWEDEIESLRESYLGIPLVLALSAGEFGVDEARRSRANNMSITVLCLTNNYSWRSGTRPLQNKLIAAGSRLTMCNSPVQVMEAALKGAVRAGANGGQICLVDPKLQRILGKEFGYSLQAEMATENWGNTSALTDHPAPPQLGGNFPLHLKELSMAAAPAVPLQLDFEPDDMSRASCEEREDILTLIVRTLRAVFIPDSTKPEYYCNQEAIEAGNIKCQLAIPLIGSVGKAIATLQLSFPKRPFLDRESFALWIGYAQQIATNLERAQEAEEREILARVTKLGNSIIQRPIALDTSPYTWCREYLDTVAGLLGADGGHIRILQQGVNGKEYQLVDAVGFLGDLLMNTRKSIREDDGSYNKEFFVKDGRVLNTQADCAVIIKEVKAIENEARFGASLRNKLGSVKSLATLPLYDQEQVQGQVLGSFIIYSRREYLFTERRERIARAAAARAGVIVRAKKSDYERAQLDKVTAALGNDRTRADFERKWMLDSLTTVTKGTANERLRSLLERVCRFAWADVGSVFVWNEATESLILHTSYNWHNGRESEGKANYKKGEGWTGGIALQKDEVIPLTPEKWRAEYQNRFYEEMIPPEHRIGNGGSEVRIGIRLTADNNLIGVMTLVYYKGDIGDAAAKDIYLLNTLKLITRFITLCVEAAKQESAQRQMRQLRHTKDIVANQIIHAAGSHRGWQAVADALRSGFNVERVHFYRALHNNKLVLKWTSPHLAQPFNIEDSKPVEPFGALGDLVLRHQDVLIKSPDDPRLENWPDRDKVKNLYATPVVDTQGHMRGAVVYINHKKCADHPFEFFDKIEKSAARDITLPIAAALEHLEMTREFEELTHKLVTATKIGTSGLFSSIVMHQIMTPFYKMRIAIDWLLKYSNSSEEERFKRLRRIEDQISKAVKLIDEALHRFTSKVQAENLRIVIRGALLTVEQSLVSARITTDVINELDVPIKVNLWSMVTALENLLSNAIDAMKGEEVRKLTIFTELSEDKLYARICIRNTGLQLSSTQIARFFQPDFTTKNKRTHTGMGITLAKKAIEDASGKLEMYPHPQGGVEAIVSLPVANNLVQVELNGDQL